MKTIAIFAGVILLSIGLAVATGIEMNPSQAFLAIPCIAVAAVCFRVAGRKERKHAQRERKVYHVYNYQTGEMDVRVA